MNQAELIKAVSEQSSLPQVQVESVLKALGGVVQEELTSNGEVTVPGIGKFSVTTRAARTGRNPRTGEQIKIAEKNVPKFTAAKALKDAADN